MRSIYALLLLSLISISTIAQSTFAPVGAKWIHEMSYGIFHVYVSGDTIIKGKSCRSIEQIALVNPLKPAPSIGNHQTLYVYNTADTVFAYNEYFSDFTPLYVFNVNEGDTICLPAFPSDYGFNFDMKDSTFCIYVDSVRMVLYDTATLKTIYTHSIAVPGKKRMKTGPYAERIGDILSGLMYECDSNCMLPLSDSYQNIQNMRCYSDSTIAIKLDTGECDKGIKLSITSLNNTAHNIVVYPNPADNIIQIRQQNFLSTVTYKATLTDMQGRVVLQQRLGNDMTVYISSVPSGVYMLRLFADGIYFGYSKVIIE